MVAGGWGSEAARFWKGCKVSGLVAGGWGSEAVRFLWSAERLKCC